MATLWDYIAELENHRAPVTRRNRIALTVPPVKPAPTFDPFVEEQIPVSRIPLDPLHPNQDAVAKYGGVVPTERPILVPPTEVVAPVVENPVAPIAPISAPDELTEAINRVRELENSPVENNDKGVLGRIGDVLRQMVVSGGQSYDRGIQSGLKPIEALAGAGGGAVAGGLYGGFHPQVDEERQRLYDISKGQKDVANIKSEREWKLGQDTRKAQLEVLKQKPIIEQRKLGQKDTELALRQSRQEFQKVNAEQKTVLSSIMKRGYYKEGVNPKEDARLESLGVVLPDFDSRKREVKEQAGKFYQRNPDTNLWEEANGLPEDASEVPIDFIIGGKNMKLRPRDIANIEASKERQASQQSFQTQQTQQQQEFTLKRDAILQNMRMQTKAYDDAEAAKAKETDDLRKQEAEKRAQAAKAELMRLQKELKDLN